MYVRDNKKNNYQIYIPYKVNIIDFTEQKLLSMSRVTKDLVKKLKYLEYLTDYKKNKIAIAWSKGEPIFLLIHKG